MVRLDLSGVKEVDQQELLTKRARDLGLLFPFWCLNVRLGRTSWGMNWMINHMVSVDSA